MKKYFLDTTIRTPYDNKNSGQRLEYLARLAIIGKACKADNLPASKGADIGTIQLKSNRATVCNGSNLEKAMQADKATMYGYIAKDGTMYLLNPAEYRDLVLHFSRIEKASERSRQREPESIRLKYESRKMIAFLEGLN